MRSSREVKKILDSYLFNEYIIFQYHIYQPYPNVNRLVIKFTSIKYDIKLHNRIIENISVFSILNSKNDRIIYSMAYSINYNAYCWISNKLLSRELVSNNKKDVDAYFISKFGYKAILL